MVPEVGAVEEKWCRVRRKKLADNSVSCLKPCTITGVPLVILMQLMKILRLLIAREGSKQRRSDIAVRYFKAERWKALSKDVWITHNTHCRSNVIGCCPRLRVRRWR